MRKKGSKLTAIVKIADLIFFYSDQHIIRFEYSLIEGWLYNNI